MKSKEKTGFEQSLEGEQVWPPKSFKVKVSISEKELEECKVPINYPDTYNPLIPFSTP